MAESVKEKAKSVIDNLPEDSTMDDIMHALYIQIKFNNGINQIEEGKGIPHEEAKEMIRKTNR
jgi:DNA gyrase/topoisomerase IV subunit B